MSKVVLLHGWATDNNVWDDVTSGIEGAVTVGLPSHNAGTGKWTDSTLSSAVSELEKKTKGEEFTGIGWSLGGKVLIKAVIEKRISLKALVLVSSTPCFVLREGFPHGQSAALVRRMIMDMSTDPTATLKRFYKLNFTEDELMEEEAESFIRHYEGVSNNFDHEGVTNALKALKEADLREGLNELKVPTLIIHGSEDSVTPLEASKYMHEKIRGSLFVIIEGAGHAPFITQREVFVRAVNQFIGSI